MTTAEHSKADDNKNVLNSHFAANLFPLMEQKDLRALAEDILKSGQQHSIKLLDGKIIDGRNRYQACLMAGVKPITEEVKVDDPFKYAISQNLHRRHLKETQRAWVAASILKNDPHVYTQFEAAKMMNVSLRSVASASAVLAKAVPEIQEAVQQGIIAVSTAGRISVFDEKMQRELLTLEKRTMQKKILEQERIDFSEGEIRTEKVSVHFTKNQITIIDNAIKRLASKNSRSQFIQEVVLSFCETGLPPTQAQLKKLVKPKYIKRSYSEKDLKIGKKGISKQEEDETREEEKSWNPFANIKL